jgi:hypothetical protein
MTSTTLIPTLSQKVKFQELVSLSFFPPGLLGNKNKRKNFTRGVSSPE